MPSPSPSLLSVLDFFVRTTSDRSSSTSTPKRMTFAEPAELYSGSKPEGSSSRFRVAAKTRSKLKYGSGSGTGRAKDDDSCSDILCTYCAYGTSTISDIRHSICSCLYDIPSLSCHWSRAVSTNVNMTEGGTQRRRRSPPLLAVQV
ncbi:hypothetical protein C8Q74DRAFT_308556 [Fomes fomentarius]|nr:hypothetical protein C8Q74DRAFT_308556 [Fomes fomentarius]